MIVKHFWSWRQCVLIIDDVHPQPVKILHQVIIDAFYSDIPRRAGLVREIIELAQKAWIHGFKRDGSYVVQKSLLPFAPEEI